MIRVSLAALLALVITAEPATNQPNDAPARNVMLQALRAAGMAPGVMVSIGGR